MGLLFERCVPHLLAPEGVRRSDQVSGPFCGLERTAPFFTRWIDHADVVLAVNEKTELRTEFTAVRVGRGAASRE
jgi:hypothetical protein